jgi:hypothetical protein
MVSTASMTFRDGSYELDDDPAPTMCIEHPRQEGRWIRAQCSLTG